MPTYHYHYLCNVEISEGGLAKFLRFHDEPYRSGDLMLDAFQGEVEADSPEAAADMVFRIHNEDDRPTGKTCPSMSPGDVATINKQAFACQPIGWQEVPVPTNRFGGTWLDIVTLLKGVSA